ncbi:MAG TPA: DUF2807 domain-containing protein [Caulobacteraceae bacterium]|nr:DUF2807 domain-containing protein [Caulobacteraceae bacterium]
MRKPGMGAVAAIAAVAAAAGSVQAAPLVRIRGAVARVVVIPEARNDIQVTVVRSNPRLPIRVRRFGESVFVDGDIGHRPLTCRHAFGHPAVTVWGRGDIGWEAMPQIVVRTPMDAHVAAGEAVFGSVGRSDSLDLSSRGCGDWTVANVKGVMRLSLTGSGDARAGSAGAADLAVAGSGDVSVQTIAGGLTAVSTGSGDISAGQVFGRLNARVAGSGNIKALGGQVTFINAQIAGSGDVRFDGVAQTLTAQIAGSGDIRVARVTGNVERRVLGSGDVEVGR